MPRSTIGGDDPAHDLSEEMKNKFEGELYRQARKLLGKDSKERKRKIAQAREISRPKSASAQHH